ncbi:MAG: membrane protein insertion efficiency factor YidD [Pseudomonadota bacterium]
MLSNILRFGFKAPIILYRYTLKPFVGWQCRHLPTCSEYALSAVDKNGVWKGFWLMISRLSRCRPGGSDGFDPVPDLSNVRYPLWKAWRYGIWSKPKENLFNKADS